MTNFMINRQLVKEQDKGRSQAVKMKFLRRTKVPLRDQIRNEGIRAELSIFNVNEQIEQYLENQNNISTGWMQTDW